MLNKKFIHLIMLAAMLTGLFSLKPATSAHAATQTVNTLTDENDGSCLDGDCSLRDAIAVSADNDTITFSVTGTIVLTAALTVDKSLTITGPGSAQLTLDGNNQYQIFILSDDTPTNTINISGMTMTKGYANPAVVCGGGAIRSWAFLTMNDVVITNNHAPADVVNCFYPRGGGVLFFNGKGSLTLTNSTISNNSTYWGGGGVYFQSQTGNVSLDNVIVDGNQSTGSDGGGMSIENALATASITNSTFSNNNAIGSGSRGGGLLLYKNITTPTVTIQNSTFSLNTAYDGGGIYIYQLPVTITNSTIADNTTSNDGGGLYNYDGTITINSSTIKGNIASGGGNSEGAGIYNLGNNGTGSITIVNSTLTGNRSTNGKGGAIFNHASGNTVNDIATINIVNSTIVGNSAKNNLGGGGVVASTAAGNEVSTITLSNSIVYGNILTTGTGSENCLITNSATIVTNNHNLFQNLLNDCTPGVNDVSSNLATSAVVNALASNGGATQTMSLPSGSPSVNNGNDAVCIAAPVSNTSQNGVTRPAGSACDIGAFEREASFGTISKWTSALDLSHGWTVADFARTTGDVDGDGDADLVGFGLDGVYVALSNGSSFAPTATKWTSAMDLSHGWTVKDFVRTVGDVDGDGDADLVGFGLDGVYVALSNGSSFAPTATKWTSAMDLSHGWTVKDFVRTVGDVDGDGDADLVGFGLDGVYVALSNGSSFAPTATKWTSAMDLSHGWTVKDFVRTVGDVDGDGDADLVGFGLDGVYVALSNGSSFAPTATKWTSAMDLSHGWTVKDFVRTVGDVDGDGDADLVGFGLDGVYVVLSNGSNFAPTATKWTSAFDLSHGWTVTGFVRTLGDVDGDGDADLVGFGLDGVYTAIAQ